MPIKAGNKDKYISLINDMDNQNSRVEDNSTITASSQNRIQAITRRNAIDYTERNRLAEQLNMLPIYDINELEEQRLLNETSEARRKAENQGVFTKVANGLAQTGVELVLGTLGGLARIPDLFVWGYNKATGEEYNFENPVADTIDEWNEEFRGNVAPIYTSDESSIGNAIGYVMQQMPTVGTIASFIVPSKALSSGLKLLGKGLTIGGKIGTGTKIAKVVAERNIINTANKLNREINIARDAGRLDEVERLNAELARVGDLSENASVAARNLANARVLAAQNKYRQFVDTSLESLSGAYLWNIQEATHNYKQSYAEQLERLNALDDKEHEEFINNNREKNPEFANMTNEEIAQKMAYDVASSTFSWDTAVFAAANFTMLHAAKRLMGAGFRKAVPPSQKMKSEAQKVFSQITGRQAEEEVAKRTFLNKLLPSPERGKHIAYEALSNAVNVGGRHIVADLMRQKPNEYFGLPADRTFFDYLSDPSIWESAFWALAGGVAYGKAYSALTKGFNKAIALYKKNIGVKHDGKRVKISDEEYNTIVNGNERSRIIQLQSISDKFDKFKNKLDLIEKGKDPFSPIRDTNGKIMKDEITGEDLYESLSSVADKDALKDSAFNELLESIVLDSVDYGNYDILREWLKNGLISEGLAKRIPGFNVEGERAIGEKMINRANEIYDKYSMYIDAMVSASKGVGKLFDSDKIGFKLRSNAHVIRNAARALVHRDENLRDITAGDESARDIFNKVFEGSMSRGDALYQYYSRQYIIERLKGLNDAFGRLNEQKRKGEISVSGYNATVYDLVKERNILYKRLMDKENRLLLDATIEDLEKLITNPNMKVEGFNEKETDITKDMFDLVENYNAGFEFTQWDNNAFASLRGATDDYTKTLNDLLTKLSEKQIELSKLHNSEKDTELYSEFDKEISEKDTELYNKLNKEIDDLKKQIEEHDKKSSHISEKDYSETEVNAAKQHASYDLLRTIGETYMNYTLDDYKSTYAQHAFRLDNYINQKLKYYSDIVEKYFNDAKDEDDMTQRWKNFINQDFDPDGSIGLTNNDKKDLSDAAEVIKYGYANSYVGSAFIHHAYMIANQKLQERLNRDREESPSDVNGNGLKVEKEPNGEPKKKTVSDDAVDAAMAAADKTDIDAAPDAALDSLLAGFKERQNPSGTAISIIGEAALKEIKEKNETSIIKSLIGDKNSTEYKDAYDLIFDAMKESGYADKWAKEGINSAIEYFKKQYDKTISEAQKAEATLSSNIHVDEDGNFSIVREIKPGSELMNAFEKVLEAYKNKYAAAGFVKLGSKVDGKYVTRYAVDVVKLINMIKNDMGSDNQPMPIDMAMRLVTNIVNLITEYSGEYDFMNWDSRIVNNPTEFVEEMYGNILANTEGLLYRISRPRVAEGNSNDALRKNAEINHVLDNFRLRPGTGKLVIRKQGKSISFGTFVVNLRTENDERIVSDGLLSKAETDKLQKEIEEALEHRSDNDYGKAAEEVLKGYKTKNGKPVTYVEIGFVANVESNETNTAYKLNTLRAGFKYEVGKTSSGGADTYFANTDSFFKALFDATKHDPVEGDAASDLIVLLNDIYTRMLDVKNAIKNKSTTLDINSKEVTLSNDELESIKNNALIKELIENKVYKLYDGEDAEHTAKEEKEAYQDMVKEILKVIYKDVMPIKGDKGKDISFEESYNTWKERLYANYDTTKKIANGNEKFNPNFILPYSGTSTIRKGFDPNNPVPINEALWKEMGYDKIDKYSPKIVFVDHNTSNIMREENNSIVTMDSSEALLYGNVRGVAVGMSFGMIGGKERVVWFDKTAYVTNRDLLSAAKKELQFIFDKYMSGNMKLTDVQAALDDLIGHGGVYYGYKIYKGTDKNGADYLQISAINADTKDGKKVNKHVMTIYSKDLNGRDNRNILLTNGSENLVTTNTHKGKANFNKIAAELLVDGIYVKDGETIRVVGEEIRNGDFRINNVLKFNTIYAMLDSRLEKGNKNRYVERTANGFTVKIGTEAPDAAKANTYSGFMDYALKNAAFATSSQVYISPDGRGGFKKSFFKTNLEPYKSRYLKVFDKPISKVFTYQDINKGRRFGITLKKGEEVQIGKEKDTDTRQFYTKPIADGGLGIDEDAADIMMGKDGAPKLLPDEFVITTALNKNGVGLEGSFENGKIKLTLLGQTAGNVSVNEMVRVLLHEQLHKTISEKDKEGGFNKSQWKFDKTAKEIINVFQEAVSKFKDFKDGKEAANIDTDTRNDIVDHIENLLNKMKDIESYRQAIGDNKEKFSNNKYAEEILTEIFTNKHLMQYLNSLEYDSGFKTNTKRETFFEKLIHALLDFFGIDIRQGSYLAKQYELFIASVDAASAEAKNFNKLIEDTKATKANKKNKFKSLEGRAFDDIQTAFSDVRKADDFEKSHKYYVGENEADVSVTTLIKGPNSMSEDNPNRIYGLAGNIMDAVNKRVFDKVNGVGIITDADIDFLNLSDADKEFLKSGIFTTIKSEIDRIVGTSDYYTHTEDLPIAAKVITDKHPEGLTVVGMPDMLINDGDGYWIIDFKTQKAGSAEADIDRDKAINNHKSQVNLYRRIIETVNGKKVKGIMLVVFGTNPNLSKLEKVTVDGDGTIKSKGEVVKGILNAKAEVIDIKIEDINDIHEDKIKEIVPIESKPAGPKITSDDIIKPEVREEIKKDEVIEIDEDDAFADDAIDDSFSIYREIDSEIEVPIKLDKNDGTGNRENITRIVMDNPTTNIYPIKETANMQDFTRTETLQDQLYLAEAMDKQLLNFICY